MKMDFPSMFNNLVSKIMQKVESALMPPPPSPVVPKSAVLQRDVLVVDPQDLPGNPWKVASPNAIIFEGSLRDNGGGGFFPSLA